MQQLSSPTRRRSLGALAALALIAAAATAAPVHAQEVLQQGSAMTVRQRFLTDLDTLHAKIVALAKAFPAEKYSWRPAPGVRSVGEAFMHVASEYYVFTPMAYGATPSPVVGRGRQAFEAFEAKSSKDSVLKHLDEGFAYMKQQIEALPPEKITGTQKLFGGDRTIVETTLIMSGDLHEHLGQLIAYARMNGVVPPWSK